MGTLWIGEKDEIGEAPPAATDLHLFLRGDLVKEVKNIPPRIHCLLIDGAPLTIQISVFDP